MAKCIQLEMECAAVCYVAAQLMSLGSEKAKELAVYVQTYATSATMNVASIKQNIARNVGRHVKYVRKNAEKCKPRYKAGTLGRRTKPAAQKLTYPNSLPCPHASWSHTLTISNSFQVTVRRRAYR